MRSKKLAVRFGLVSVLLMSLSVAAATERVATPGVQGIQNISWRGGLLLSFSCETPGATIRLTYAPEGKIAAYPTASSYIYRPGSWFLITKPCMFRAKAYKTGWYPSFTRTVGIGWS
jgi:hypothetical protein